MLSTLSIHYSVHSSPHLTTPSLGVLRAVHEGVMSGGDANVPTALRRRYADFADPSLHPGRPSSRRLYPLASALSDGGTHGRWLAAPRLGRRRESLAGLSLVFSGGILSKADVDART